ncbi:thiosulfate oxidation carrier complex protein SoxZ [Henriciella aquimarina]|uniref:thiosulfate oxidation carrier complex protein SoxZ n=1 Tax=Henriciella aquimarina TaxID=545261 RepID=UPI0009FFBA1B|nr:thiosulfate oxidation carrier complex protein SoxZ [Henriciella aquimarina]
MTIRIAAPDTAKKGEVIEIKALIQHPMETGYRSDSKGKEIPRDIITEFECSYDGETVFAANFFPAIAANPFLTFYTKATTSGTLEFTWTDQDGESWSETHDLTVE